MDSNKIVVRFADGSITKGFCSDFSPLATSFNIKLLNGQVKSVQMDKLKAVFFVRDFLGEKDYDEHYRDVDPWGGKKVEVHFHDGEVILGYALHYDTGHHGFFIKPANSRSNNKNIFILTSAIKKVTFL